MKTTTYHVEPLERHELDEVLRDYVCSTCWSPLNFEWSGEKWYALCQTCKEETQGYTSAKFAKRKREESEHEYVEAAHNLRDVLGMRVRKSAKEILAELGF